jgi:hypothetical protein
MKSTCGYPFSTDYMWVGHYVGPLKFEHDGIPTYEECRDMIRQGAHRLWRDEGCPPGDGVDFWLRAEKVLFNHPEQHFLFGGYRIYVRDRTKPKVNGYYDHWAVVIVSPTGPWELTESGVKAA